MFFQTRSESCFGGHPRFWPLLLFWPCLGYCWSEQTSPIWSIVFQTKMVFIVERWMIKIPFKYSIKRTSKGTMKLCYLSLRLKHICLHNHIFLCYSWKPVFVKPLKSHSSLKYQFKWSPFKCVEILFVFINRVYSFFAGKHKNRWAFFSSLLLSNIIWGNQSNYFKFRNLILCRQVLSRRGPV